jgi:hypothetical protein
MTELKNDNRLSDGVKVIRELGKDAALGKDSLPKLAFQLTKMAAEGVIDTEKNYTETLPDNSVRNYDDAEYLFGEYAKAEGKKAVHERSAGGLKANISKARQIIQFGCMTTCDPQDVLERAVKARAKVLENGDKAKSAYAAYVDVARNQIAADADLTDEQLEAIVRKPPAAAPEVEKILRGVYKKLEDLIAGEKGVQDQSEHVVAAFDAVRDRLAEIDAVNAGNEAAEAVTMLTPAARNALLAQLGYVQTIQTA